MKRFLIMAVLSIVVISCDEDNKDGGCATPQEALEQIASLSNIVTKGQVAGRPSCIVYTGAQISACMHKGDRIYYLNNPLSSESTCGFIAYDCLGDEVFNKGTAQAEWEAFEGERTEEELLWEKD